MLVQVTDQDTNATLYFEALNYNIAQSADNSLITTALAGLLPAITGPITAANLDEATPTLEQYGVLPVTATAAAVATCTTDSLAAGTYTAVGVALAGAPLPSMQLCLIVDGITAQRSAAGHAVQVCHGAPLPSAGRAVSDVFLFCRPHLWWIACGTAHPGCGRGRLHFHSPQSMHCATIHCSNKALVQGIQGSCRCWSHELCTSTAALGGHLQTGLQTLVPTPVYALQANTLIYSNDSPAAKAGASTTLTVLVNNTDAPPSDLYLDGEHLHLLMMVHTV